MAISKIDSDGITAGGITADSLDIGQIGGRRNLIINGAMTVWQRGTSADTASSNDYMSDRWQVAHSGLDGNVDWDQETSSTPNDFGYALKISTDASETSLDAGDYLLVRQGIEAQNLQHLNWGTANAKSLTVSFWVRSSVASTYTLDVYQADSGTTLGATYTVDAADTWEYKTISIAANTLGTIVNDNGLGITLGWWIDAGSTFTSGTFSTAWQSNDNSERVYDTTGWLESTTPTFYITGVQLEVGSVATPFEHRSYGEELSLCSRYFFQIGYPNHPVSVGDRFGAGYMNGTTTFLGTVPVLNQMRASPSWSDSGVQVANASATQGISTVVVAASTGSTVNVAISTSGSLTSGQGTNLRFSTTTSYVKFDAEL